ncbi:MAG: hypothetical protein KatS3mg068_2610 [Candidatus Sericytochromatia bacterium]|nr:MAG: hypothetical protein KatS3mg068_2610 [Candidatus Sericytochromatia bacterium]
MGNVGNSNNYNKYTIGQDNTKVYKQPIIQEGNEISIGSSDRSIWEREDTLIFNKIPLKKGLTDKEAEEFAKKNSGAEIIIREQDGTYSVYSIKTSEEGKTINNKDFENINVIDITKDVLKIVGGKKAYISTSDNTFRTFDKASFSLDFLEDDFISTNINLNLQDIDGIDTSSKKDLKGSLNGNITIDKDLIKYSLQNAENQTGVDFDLQADPKNNQYIVKCYYSGVPIGDIAITPTSTGLKLNVSGLAAGAKYIVGGATLGVTGVAIASQINLGKIVEGITNNFSKDMGFKVKSNSDTEYILEPDFKSNAFLKEIQLKDNNKIKIEEINVNPNDLKIKLDEYGNLVVDIKKAEVIASTNPDGQIAKQDEEGSDYLNIKLKGELRNDFQAKVNTTIDLNVNITNEEKKLFSK